jgi:hypothetical protein
MNNELNNVWKKLEEYFNSEEELELHGGKVEEEEINSAESELGLEFHSSYRDFVSNYGAGVFEGYFVHGLRYLLLMDENIWTVTQNTKFYKEKQGWPGIEDWYVISDDGRGNPIGIDPNGIVWLSDHDAGFEKVKLADNFQEFLHKLLNDTLYED